MRRLAPCLLLAAPLSCYAPDRTAATAGDDTTAALDESSSSGMTSTDPSGPESTDGSADATTVATTTTSADDDSSSSGDMSDDDSSGDDESSSGGEPAVCGDGTLVPGELCYDDLVLFDGGDVTYASRLTDVDGDGDDDLVWMIGDQIGVRLGTGDGEFGSDVGGPTLFPSDGDVGDVDGDGFGDYAVINDYDSTLQIVRGDGDGSFVEPMGTQPTSMTPRVVLVADLDGAMGAEVLVGTGTSVDVFKSDGDTTPQPGWGFGGTGDVYALGLGSFNGDDDVDILYVRDYAGVRSIIARLGDGDASFGSQSILDTAGDMPTAVGGGDFDGDGDGDVAYVDGADALLYVQLGNGAFGFGDAQSVATDTDPRRMLVLDATGDGDMDVVVGHGTSNALWIIPGDGTGGFGEPLHVALAGPVDSLGMGEANGDGLPDFVTTDSGYENITVIMSTP